MRAYTTTNETAALTLRSHVSRFCMYFLPLRFMHNRLVHRFYKKTSDSTGFYRFNCMDDLLSEPNWYRLWFDLLLVRPPIRSGSNNYASTSSKFRFKLDWSEKLSGSLSPLFDTVAAVATSVAVVAKLVTLVTSLLSSSSSSRGSYHCRRLELSIWPLENVGKVPPS